ncbi:MAG TPA: phosphate ABC transporter ATP-binding protein PstB [Candidatus Dormibacteraeota bacterium]|nr:phosphate ABC transporter ATP-binding protein PstB [Candidatus Dormibacteraeota bacterium]
MSQPKNTAKARSKGFGVRLRRLHAFYDEVEAVKGVDIDFPANKITAIIGPSGCGKSTLVRCINRMHEEVPGASAKGQVLLDDLDIYDTNIDPVAVRRTVGMVFQRPNPFPTMSIIDNVTAGPRLSGVKNGELHECAERALKDAGLWNEVKGRLNKNAGGLSGGQQQRLCIARMIALEPEVLLMDEPCSALDPLSTLRIEELIVKLKGRFTVVLVTHNLQQAVRIADRTAFMLDGELVEVGPTKRIFASPKDSRTLQYVTGKFG